MREMPCQELVEVVTDYLEGALPAPDVFRFEEHLAECEACREYLEQIRHTIALVGRFETEAIAPATRDGLLQAFRGWAREPG
jgi:anti-sigma factor RsiW